MEVEALLGALLRAVMVTAGISADVSGAGSMGTWTVVSVAALVEISSALAATTPASATHVALADASTVV
jgi:hypothetical protein